MTKLYLNGEDLQWEEGTVEESPKDKELKEKGLKGIKLTYDTNEEENEYSVFGTKL
jgi:hypothetical protein